MSRVHHSLALSYRSEINALIAEEVELQIQEQVAAQLVEQGLNGLEDQAREGIQQVKDVRVALINS